MSWIRDRDGQCHGHADIFGNAHRCVCRIYLTYDGYSVILSDNAEVDADIRIRMAIPSRGSLDFSLKVLQSLQSVGSEQKVGVVRFPKIHRGPTRFLSVEKFIKVANINMINIRTTSSGNENLTDKLAPLCCRGSWGRCLCAR